MLFRSLIFFVLSASALLGWEIVYHRSYRNKEIPLSMGFALLLCVMTFRISAAFLGVLLTTFLWPYGENRNLFRLEVLAGILLGMWSAMIALQFAQNAVRAKIGAKTIPVEWIRARKKPKRRSKK